MFAFYFRVPVKAFFRTRIDYLAFPRAINPLLQSTGKWSWAGTTPGILAYAIRTHGWSFIPNQVLPPLLANVTVGAVLYTSYLGALGLYYEPASHSSKRIYPPAPFSLTFAAGFSAGAFQSVIAAPLDALTIRFKTTDLTQGTYKNMWDYASRKLQAIGARGAFAGWGLSFVKDAFGYGLFFGTFEYVKSQLFYEYVSHWYSRYGLLSMFHKHQIDLQRITDQEDRPVIKPHYLMEPSFILLAGATASVLQQVVAHPLTRIQELHFQRLATLDELLQTRPGRLDTMQLYARAYQKTWIQAGKRATKSGGWLRWLYQDFWMTTLRQVPSTSAGLIMFEIFRRKYGMGEDAVKIPKDEYDILLP
ncbi:hypothetical protein D6C86_01102 [Aureobasidium pullulans]|nr:hypothetical protein JADG_000288 [Aureobasidium pullulans]THV76923.1 hypothetical protein D6D28_00720 [Aureobasidium pullulans]THV87887.1 hypothetical protein D6D29_00395 [Aureobasidium pullulans]THV88696.1 hypothetical protein D6D27_07106 [Aureobasidium pullulans]THW09291.1 hypothetical protein D6D26_00437 [Aureobasidium pullulans]